MYYECDTIFQTILSQFASIKDRKPTFSTSLTLTSKLLHSIRLNLRYIRIPIWTTKRPNTMIFLTRFSQPYELRFLKSLTASAYAFQLCWQREKRAFFF